MYYYFTDRNLQHKSLFNEEMNLGDQRTRLCVDVNYALSLTTNVLSY